MKATAKSQFVIIFVKRDVKTTEEETKEYVIGDAEYVKKLVCIWKYGVKDFEEFLKSDDIEMPCYAYGTLLLFTICKTSPGD